MDNFETYKSHELLQLLEILEEEEDPSCELYRRKEQIRKIAAKKLGIEQKEVMWLTKKKSAKKFKKDENEQNEKKEQERKKLKYHNQIILELQIMNNEIQRLNKKVEEIDKNL